MALKLVTPGHKVQSIPRQDTLASLAITAARFPRLTFADFPMSRRTYQRVLSRTAKYSDYRELVKTSGQALVLIILFCLYAEKDEALHG